MLVDPSGTFFIHGHSIQVLSWYLTSITSKDKELASKDKELASKDKELASKDDLLKERDERLKEKDERLKERDESRDVLTSLAAELGKDKPRIEKRGECVVIPRLST
jgi:hypothetical protein